MTVKIALTIAGSDSGGGAGIQADLKTFSALGTYGASVITAITAQNTCEVRAVEVLSEAIIRAQIEAVYADLPPKAVKTGMLSDSRVIHTVSKALQAVGVENLVVDTVMVAKSGDKLLQDEAISSLKKQLIPHATIITPNIPEAEVLLGRHIKSPLEMEKAASDLLKLGCESVLLKGGHFNDSSSSNDFFINSQTSQWLSDKRINSNNTHGTGCTLSAAITAGLAKNLPLLEAVTEAKAYISAAISAADTLNIGKGHGPVHHFHQWWQV